MSTSYLSFGILKATIQMIITLLLAMFIFGLGYILCTDFSIPLARITQEGMWFKYHGFVAWHNIENIFEYQCYGTPLIAIGITIKNYEMLFKQSSISGKYSLFWAKIFGHPHIILANIDMENAVIIEHAKKFLK